MSVCSGGLQWGGGGGNIRALMAAHPWTSVEGWRWWRGGGGGLGCEFRFLFPFRTGLIFRNPPDSADSVGFRGTHGRIKHSRARLNPQESDGFQSRNPEGRTSDLRGKDPTHDTSATILPCCLFHIIRHRRHLRRQPPYAARDIPSQ